MINYGEDGIISVAVGELGDQVHGYDFEWLGQRWDVNFVWRGNGSVCECLVLLAFCTSFNVIFDPFGHGGPPGDSFGDVDGPISSYMCCCWFVVY